MFKRKQQRELTYLSATSEFQGSLHIEGDLQVDGIVHGEVDVVGNVVVSKNGLVEGPEIRAHNITIHGAMKARVVAEGTLSISKTGRLEGDVTAHALDIRPGAFYRGYIATTDVRALPASPEAPLEVPQLSPEQLEALRDRQH